MSDLQTYHSRRTDTVVNTLYLAAILLDRRPYPDTMAWGVTNSPVPIGIE